MISSDIERTTTFLQSTKELPVDYFQAMQRLNSTLNQESSNCVSCINLSDIQPKTLTQIPQHQRIEVQRDLAIIKACLKANNEAKQSELYYRVKTSLHKIKQINGNQKFIKKMWELGQLKVVDHQLVISNKLMHRIGDQEIDTLLHPTNLSMLASTTYINIAALTAITSHSVTHLVQSCPLLEPSSFAGCFSMQRLCDHTLVVKGQEIYVNKALVSCYSNTLKDLWQSNFEESKSPTTQIELMEYSAARDCFNALVGSYDISKETDCKRLVDLAHAANFLDISYLLQKIKDRFTTLLNEQINRHYKEAYEVFSTIHTLKNIDSFSEINPILFRRTSEYFYQYFQNLLPPDLKTVSHVNTPDLDSVNDQQQYVNINELYKYLLQATNTCSEFPTFPFDSLSAPLSNELLLHPKTDASVPFPIDMLRYAERIKTIPELSCLGFFMEGFLAFFNWQDQVQSLSNAKISFQKALEYDPEHTTMKYENHIEKYVQLQIDWKKIDREAHLDTIDHCRPFTLSPKSLRKNYEILLEKYEVLLEKNALAQDSSDNFVAPAIFPQLLYILARAYKNSLEVIVKTKPDAMQLTSDEDSICASMLSILIHTIHKSQCALSFPNTLSCPTEFIEILALFKQVTSPTAHLSFHLMGHAHLFSWKDMTSDPQSALSCFEKAHTLVPENQLYYLSWMCTHLSCTVDLDATLKLAEQELREGACIPYAALWVAICLLKKGSDNARAVALLESLEDDLGKQFYAALLLMGKMGISQDLDKATQILDTTNTYIFIGAFVKEIKQLIIHYPNYTITMQSFSNLRLKSPYEYILKILLSIIFD